MGTLQAGFRGGGQREGKGNEVSHFQGRTETVCHQERNSVWWALKRADFVSDWLVGTVISAFKTEINCFSGRLASTKQFTRHLNPEEHHYNETNLNIKLWPKSDKMSEVDDLWTSVSHDLSLIAGWRETYILSYGLKKRDPIGSATAKGTRGRQKVL
jgi:hypothetical protein